MKKCIWIFVIGLLADCSDQQLTDDMAETVWTKVVADTVYVDRLAQEQH